VARKCHAIISISVLVENQIDSESGPDLRQPLIDDLIGEWCPLIDDLIEECGVVAIKKFGWRGAIRAKITKSELLCGTPAVRMQVSRETKHRTTHCCPERLFSLPPFWRPS